MTASGRPGHCRACGAVLDRTFLDLGCMPLANSYLTEEELRAGREARYPLHARVCDRCFLVQVDEVVPPQDIFSDYAYFSSYSETWVDHARRFAGSAAARLGLGGRSLVLEVASNDGYLLRHFVRAGIPVLGVEPAANVAEVALAAGVPTEVRFFGQSYAEELTERGVRADLVVANNVLAHVPDLNDFLAGIATVLKPDAVASIEVPHLLRMLERVEFDTIYHEHFSYFSLLSAVSALDHHGLRVIEVEEIATHGGSLRIWASNHDSSRPVSPSVGQVLDRERRAGLDRVETYEGFSRSVQRVAQGLQSFLREVRASRRKVGAYGAAAKASTLLNYCGVTVDDIPYVVDRSPHKQGKYLPGAHLPILDPDEVRRDRPDFLLILAWNLAEEIMGQMADVRSWQGKFVIPVPELVVVP